MTNSSLDSVPDELERSDQADFVSTAADDQWNVDSTSNFALDETASRSHRQNRRQRRSHSRREIDYW